MKSSCFPFIILLITALMGFEGCSDNPAKPEHLIPQDTYINLLVELQLTRSYSERLRLDSLQVDSLLNQIFDKYDVNGTQFKKSHNYYQQFPKRQKKRIEQAIARLDTDYVKDKSKPVRDSLFVN